MSRVDQFRNYLRQRFSHSKELSDALPKIPDSVLDQVLTCVTNEQTAADAFAKALHLANPNSGSDHAHSSGNQTDLQGTSRSPAGDLRLEKDS